MVKKYIKSFIISFIATIILCISIITLTSCGDNGELDVNQNLKLEANAVINNLSQNVYNSSVLENTQGTAKFYSVEQIQELIPNFSYYVKLGKINNFNEIKHISFGDQTFDANDKFDLSIGNNNFIQDKYFYISEESIYVSAPIIVFEALNGNKVQINNKSFDIFYENNVDEISFSRIAFENGTTNAVEKVDNTEYNLTLSDATTYLQLYYDDAEANDIVITKKTRNNALQGYGLTKVENVEGYPLGYYPVGYSTDFNDISADINNSSIVYQAYIVGKGIATVTLNISVL